MNIIQYKTPNTHSFYSQCMQTLKDKIPSDVSYIVREFDTINRPDIASRKIRIDALLEDPCAIWMDIDCVMLKWFDFPFKEGKPYVYSDGCRSAVMYANGCVSVFNEMMNKFRENFACPCGFIRENLDKFYTFPEGYISHLHIGKQIRQGLKGVWANKYCSVKPDGTDFQLTINQGV